MAQEKRGEDRRLQYLLLPIGTLPNRTFPVPISDTAPGQIPALWADGPVNPTGGTSASVAMAISDNNEVNVQTRPEDDLGKSKANTVCLGSGTIAGRWRTRDAPTLASPARSALGPSPLTLKSELELTVRSSKLEASNRT
ncbi:unnamed protein product [Tilletia controversa]|nr:unnamed protein product [Tilletia controversa]